MIAITNEYIQNTNIGLEYVDANPINKNIIIRVNNIIIAH